jgi:predicted TIM-barrel fold metal-dependent hydrolase
MTKIPDATPEHNVTGQDYGQRGHFTYAGPPIIDVHAHVTMTSPEDKPAGPAGGYGAAGSSDAAALMLDVAAEFGITRTVSMCPVQDIAPLRERLGDRILFNGMLGKKPDEPEDVAYRLLDDFLAAGVKIIKLWAAPRGRDRGLLIDTPWRVECLRRARAAGIKIVMVHVGDPDAWWNHTYTDLAKYGSKESQYPPFLKLVEEFSDLTWIGAHMGGDPEHPDHLEEMLTKYPNYFIDTSATKWQVREVSPRGDAIRSLITRFPKRFLFGSDLVTRHGLTRDHYVSRYWCQRTLWDSTWTGRSPIADPDYTPGPDGERTPELRGVGLPADVLRRVYRENALALLGPVG